MHRAILVALLLAPLAGATHTADPEPQFIFLSVTPFGTTGEDYLVSGLMNDHSLASNDMTVEVNGQLEASASATSYRPGFRFVSNDQCDVIVARMESPSAFLQLTILVGPACPGHDGRGVGGGAAFSGPQPTGDATLQHFTGVLRDSDGHTASFDPEPQSSAIDPRPTGLVFWQDPLWCGSVLISDADQAVTLILDSSLCSPQCEDQHKGLGLGHQRDGHPNKGEGGAKHAAPCPDHPGNHDAEKRGQGHAKFA